jgi:DNA modification methylase
VKSPGRAFGQDLMRGEHVVGGGPAVSKRLRPNKDQQVSKKLGAYAAAYGGEEQLLARGGDAAAEPSTGTSIFDPVLCELAYLWFSPKDGHVLDPFAGGSVRGIVAGCLGRRYTGIELRPEQVDANRAQLAAIKTQIAPTWIVGDSARAAELAPGEYDLVFTCPPYGDLERYSDDPADISTMDYPAFVDAFRGIMKASIGMLRHDRFACVVVGDFRDRKGFYRNFVSDTIAAVQDAGAKLYNEAILVTAVGSLSIRAGRQFSAGRKLGKTHQNVLVFCKGDPAKAAKACGDVDVSFVLESAEVGRD